MRHPHPVLLLLSAAIALLCGCGPTIEEIGPNETLFRNPGHGEYSALEVRFPELREGQPVLTALVAQTRDGLAGSHMTCLHLGVPAEMLDRIWELQPDIHVRVVSPLGAGEYDLRLSRDNFGVGFPSRWPRAWWAYTQFVRGPELTIEHPCEIELTVRCRKGPLPTQEWLRLYIVQYAKLFAF